MSNEGILSRLQGLVGILGGTFEEAGREAEVETSTAGAVSSSTGEASAAQVQA